MENYRILIVDDVASNLMLLEKILSKQNFTVITAQSGKEALELASKHEFALALIDIVMPEIDGLETAKMLQLTPCNKHLPVIFLSAILKEQHDIIKGFELGAYDYIIKPYDSVLLLNKIQVFCRLFEQKKMLEVHNEELQQKNDALKQAISESNRIQGELAESKKKLQIHQEQLEDLIDQRTEELRIARKNAEDATKAKSEFLATISHELRTPLHQILGYTKMGIDGIYKENRERLLEFFIEAYSSSQRMCVLQNNLLDLSKLESNEVVFDFQDSSLSVMIEEVVAEYYKRSNEENISLLLDFLQKEDKIIVDQYKFKQVIRNLINNAFDFSDPGDSIIIRITDENDSFRIAVIDSGIGIPEDELISVFDKFGKSSNPRSLSSGAGLGLFISNMIVTGHKGHIWAQINPDGGTIIQINIPKTQHKRKKLIGQMLVEKGYITKEQLAEELKVQQEKVIV